MTPDAAFGFERRGTPEAVAALGARDGFDVVVVPPFTLDGGPVRSSRDPRGDRPSATWRRARRLLGRPLLRSEGELADGRLDGSLADGDAARRRLPRLRRRSTA